jgi:hypothetical protein
MPRSANAVLVTGDISQDYNIYLLPPQPERRLPEGETRFVGSVGGGRQSFSGFSRKCSLCEMAMLLPASPPARRP